MLPGYASNRKELLSLAQLWGSLLGVSQETLYDTLLLLDRAACSGFHPSGPSEGTLEMMLAGCLALCVQSSEVQAAAILEAATPEVNVGDHLRCSADLLHVWLCSSGDLLHA
jgi:hypothetical protein